MTTREDVDGANPSDTWSVDPTIRFDHIHVIESLDGGFGGRTGTRLFGEMESWCVGTPVRANLHRVTTRAEVERVLREITDAAASGSYPLIHFETHGIDAGPTNRRATSGIRALCWRPVSR